MQKIIRIKCPAKLNLTLEVVNRREDGFHNIKSIMQLISLYDFLSITISSGKEEENKILLSGNSPDIPYNEKNLVFKAADLFLKILGFTGYNIKIYIEKNIPISAGLAGGSTNGAGTIYGLNKLFNEPLSREGLHKLCGELGSDLNVCLEGGTLLATMRGEKVEKLKTPNYPVTLIKPKNLGISAKEAYTKYSQKEFKPKYNMTEKMIDAIEKGKDIKEFLYNDLEYAVFDDYKELQEIKLNNPDSIMSGSGSTYFILSNEYKKPEGDFIVFPNLKFITNGVCEDVDL